MPKKTNKHTNNLIFKMGRGHEWTFFQRGHTDGQQVRGKMFNITNHQGEYAYQNHNEKIAPHLLESASPINQ